MEALGIKHLFSEPYFGGFGSDYCNPDNSEQSWKDRAELVKIAAQKAEKHFPGMWVVSVAARKRILHMKWCACISHQQTQYHDASSAYCLLPVPWQCSGAL